MTRLRSIFVFLLPVTFLGAEKPASPRPFSGLPQTGEFVFSILPKSLQKNPTLEMTVNTEFTPYGRLLRPASPTQPVYYLSQSAGLKKFGASVGGEHTPSPAALESAMTKALAMNGYLRAVDATTPASLVVVYYWGAHNAEDPETRAAFPALAVKNRLERAVLVGGKKYAAEVANIMELGAGPGDRTPEREFLWDQTADDVYFVVASAYDGQALARGERKLAWRTSMTVNTKGVSMAETLIPLVAAAAPFFGHETPEPQINVSRVPRNVRVDVGTPTVVPEKSEKR
ncbi:MAG: hypothetical protein ABIO94_11750 [Opitutaceae bacterium]